MASEAPRVLIVDDDPAMTRLLSKWLEKAGYNVNCVYDGREATYAIEEECPHVLITDWEMPEMDGLELCSWLRNQDLPHYVYSLFLTARSGMEDMVKGLHAGADDFLKKPIDKGELLARVHAGRRVIELERRLSQMAKYDSLTGLSTQGTFYDELKREWARAQRHHLRLSCVMLDLDFFKSINDTHGHPVGDKVLKQVAEVLKCSSRLTDVVCRYGGEEFCVLLPESSEVDAIAWADRVRQRIEKISIKAGEFDLNVTASFGVSQMLADTQSPQELVDLADQALLVAKQSGKNRVVGYQAMTDTISLKPSAWGPGAIFGELPAKSVMTTIFSGLHKNKTLGDAAQYFLRFRINSAPVVDDDGKLVGIISEKDVMAMMLWPSWWRTEIHEVMRPNVICYEEDTPVLTIYEFLCRVSIRSAMIVKDGVPTGVIGRGSLLRWFVNALRASPFYDAAEDPEVIKRTRDNMKAADIVKIIATNVMKEGYYLHGQSTENEESVLPMMVTAASRLQDLSNDLLSCSSEAAVHKVMLPNNSEPMSSTIEGIGRLLSSLQHLQTDTVRGH